MPKYNAHCGIIIAMALALWGCSNNTKFTDSDLPLGIDPNNHATYISMPDGVNIAADIWLPANTSADTRLPVVLELTRYWRAYTNKPARDRIGRFNRMGYAYAAVDVRGTGASFGHREVEWSAAESKDFATVIDWLADQPWSNGHVATLGVSYPGNTAELAMVGAPAALKATIPRFTDFDLYSAILFPGGLVNDKFLLPWSDGVWGLDQNSTAEIDRIHRVWQGYKDDSVKAVGGDLTRLNQAVAGHANNITIRSLIEPVTFRDDLKFARSLDDGIDHWASPHRFQDNPRLKEIPSFHWASFTDAGTAMGAIARFVASDAPMQVVIGYWTHGAYLDTNPFLPADAPTQPSFDEQYQRMDDFLRPLMGLASAAPTTRALHYFTAGENTWKTTDIWPPAGISQQRFYFAEGAQLQTEAPMAKAAADQYAVNFNAGTGPKTRWSTQFGGSDVDYSNRAEADKLLLTYTSDPLANDIEITGHPVVHLQMASSTEDGAVIAYLESVAPDGKVTMLTEGELRLIHRKTLEEEPPYPMFGPYHSFKREDAMPMVPGEMATVEFAMLPLSVQVPKGHRLRLAIAGHDKDSFKRIPQSGTPEYQIYRQVGALSYVDIPLK